MQDGKGQDGSLKAALAQGGPLIAVNPGGPAACTAAALGRHGAQILFIDCERTAIGVAQVPDLARAARAAGLWSLLRSESRDPAALTRYLDCGVDGLVLPQVEGAADCAMLARVVRDHALGPARAAAVVQIETRAGVAAAAEIGGAPGVDAVLLGPNDLALSMDLPGRPDHPDVRAALVGVAAGLRAAGRPFGLPVGPDDASEWLGLGARLLYVPLDRIIGAGLGAFRDAAPDLARRGEAA